jgi:transcriptional regulator with XRE-family HTH domain
MIGSAIAARRRELRWSQSELADQVQLNRTYLSDIERGEANVSFAVVARLAGALDVSMSDLIRRAELDGDARQPVESVQSEAQ